jgi:hypothetical protein
MTARSRAFSAMTRCLVCSVGLAALGVTWGCGPGVQSQATLDKAAEARVQEARDFQKKYLEKKAANAPRRTTGRLSKGDL